MEENNIESKKYVSSWDTLPNVLMGLGGFGLLILVFIMVASRKMEWLTLLYAVAGYAGLLCICAVIKLLVKIEFNTRK